MSTAEATKPKNGTVKDELQVAAAGLVSFVSTMHAANEPGWHEELAAKMT